jgi:hypothetical protein
MSSEPRQQNTPPTSHSAPLHTSNRRIFLLSVVTVLATVLVAFFWRDPTANLFAFRRFFGSSSRIPASSASVAGSGSAPALATSSGIAEQSEFKMKTPVYFLSHGGVSFCPFARSFRFCCDSGEFRVDSPNSRISCTTWTIRRIRN